MSSSSQTVAPASVPKSVLVSIYWFGTALSLVVLVVRLYVRRKVFGKFKADDYLVALAWLFFFATTITWTILGGELYMTIDAESGNPEAAILKYLKVYAQALNATLGTYFCTWTSLYVVKLSFMVFFHGLGNKIKAQSILWWCVLGFIVASYVISVGMFDYGCLASDWENIIANCTGNKVLNHEFATTRVSTTLDVVTDTLIMVIPGNIVWKARVPLKKKIALAGICSLTAFMMVCAIIRVAGDTKGKSTDLTWFLVWNAAEMTVAIIVACIASFRSLYTKAKNTKKYEQQSPRYNEILMQNQPQHPSGASYQKGAIPVTTQTQTVTSTTFGTDTLCEGEVEASWATPADETFHLSRKRLSEEDLWNPSLVSYQ